MRLERRRVRS